MQNMYHKHLKRAAGACSISKQQQETTTKKRAACISKLRKTATSYTIQRSYKAANQIKL